MKKISVYSGKGGVGKTSISINLAGYYSERHKLKVCVVDTDEQKSAADLYSGSINSFDVVTKEPANGYDLVIYDHHPSHQTLQLGDIVVCPIRPSRIDFESYKRSRAFIGDVPHILVVNQYSLKSADDMIFIKKLREMCTTIKLPFYTIKMRNIWKRITDKCLTAFNCGNLYAAGDVRKEIATLGEIINDQITLY